MPYSFACSLNTANASSIPSCRVRRFHVQSFTLLHFQHLQTTPRQHLGSTPHVQVGMPSLSGCESAHAHPSHSLCPRLSHPGEHVSNGYAEEPPGTKRDGSQPKPRRQCFFNSFFECIEETSRHVSGSETACGMLLAGGNEETWCI